FTEGAAGLPYWVLALCFVIDSAKGVLAASAMRAFMSNPLRFENVRDFSIFVAVVVVAIPALSAFAGAAVGAGLGLDYWLKWEQWFMGDALAQIVVTPLILYWLIAAPWRMPAPEWERIFEATALAVGLVVACSLACMVEDKSIYFTQSRFYAPLPFL